MTCTQVLTGAPLRFVAATMTRLWLTAPLILAACVHRPPGTQSLFVSGKAHECVDRLPGRAASGQTVRLLVGKTVVATDVSGPDGSFVLHPKADSDVSGAAIVEAGATRVSLANDFASWLQAHMHYRLELCLAPNGDASTPYSISSPGGDVPTPASGATPPGTQLPQVPRGSF